MRDYLRESNSKNKGLPCLFFLYTRVCYLISLRVCMHFSVHVIARNIKCYLENFKVKQGKVSATLVYRPVRNHLATTGCEGKMHIPQCVASCCWSLLEVDVKSIAKGPFMQA